MYDKRVKIPVVGWRGFALLAAVTLYAVCMHASTKKYIDASNCL